MRVFTLVSARDNQHVLELHLSKEGAPTRKHPITLEVREAGRFSTRIELMSWEVLALAEALKELVK